MQWYIVCRRLKGILVAYNPDLRRSPELDYNFEVLHDRGSRSHIIYTFRN